MYTVTRATCPNALHGAGGSCLTFSLIWTYVIILIIIKLNDKLSHHKWLIIEVGWLLDRLDSSLHVPYYHPQWFQLVRHVFLKAFVHFSHWILEFGYWWFTKIYLLQVYFEVWFHCSFHFVADLLFVVWLAYFAA